MPPELSLLLRGCEKASKQQKIERYFTRGKSTPKKKYKNVNCTDINHFNFLLQKVFVRSKLPTNFTGVSKFACLQQ